MLVPPLVPLGGTLYPHICGVQQYKWCCTVVPIACTLKPYASKSKNSEHYHRCGFVLLQRYAIFPLLQNFFVLFLLLRCIFFVTHLYILMRTFFKKKAKKCALWCVVCVVWCVLWRIYAASAREGKCGRELNEARGAFREEKKKRKKKEFWNRLYSYKETKKSKQGFLTKVCLLKTIYELFERLSYDCQSLSSITTS